MPDKAAAAHEDSDDVDNGGAAADGLRNRKLVMVEEHAMSHRAGEDMTYMYLGVAVCRDGRVILAGTCRLCLYDPVSRTVQTLTLSSTPGNAVQIDDTHIAVSSICNKAIIIVTIGDELRVEKTLKTRYHPCGIVALNNGQLAVAWDEPSALGVIDVSGTQVAEKLYMDQDTNGRKFDAFYYLAVDERRQHFIQSCSYTDTVQCYDFKGNKVFKYSHPELKRGLTGIALDKHGNIYACDSENRSLHIISPTGDPIRVIMEGVPRQPCAICSDVTGTDFWVTSWLYISYFRLQPTFKYLCLRELRELHSPFIC